MRLGMHVSGKDSASEKDKMNSEDSKEGPRKVQSLRHCEAAALRLGLGFPKE